MKLNKIQIAVGVSLVLFFVTVTGLVGTGLWVMKFQEKKSLPEKTEDVVVNSVLSVEDVAVHKTVGDCWIIISGKVYAVSGYLGTHPGGALVIAPYCGKDATEAFATKGRMPAESHSGTATGLLDEYFVGNIGEIITQMVPTTGPTLVPGQITPTSVSKQSVGNTNTQVSLTNSEVSSHNTLSNCWLIISGNVYNVTSYLYQHPGGASAISPYCGKDGTTAFATKNKGSSHSSVANNLLNNYLIGTIGQLVVLAPSPTTAVVIFVPTNTPVPQNLTLTSSEVATHNTLQNCWMIISNNVYNITSYVYQHPGGSSILAQYCGREATTAFQTQGGRGSHSNNASNLLNNFLIGTLNSSVVVNPTNTPGPGGTNPTATPASFGGSLPAAITNMYPGATKKSGGYEDNGSWEGKINTSSGQCREMKVNSSGSITENQSC